MTPENQNEPMVMNDQPMSAWEAAAAMGIDVSLLDYTLNLTPAERMRFHESKLKLLLLLEERAGLQWPSPLRVKSS